MSEEDINFLISIQDLEEPDFNNACLERENERLRNQLQQKENIIKKAINYIKEESWFCYKDNEEIIDRTLVNKLLEILEDNKCLNEEIERRNKGD